MDNGTPPKPNQTITIIVAMCTVVMWSSAFPVTRFLLQHYSPGAIMVLRFILASVILIILGFIKKTRLPALRDIPLCLGLGISGVFLYNFFFNTASLYVVAGVSSFIVASAPVITIILARIFLKEVVKPACWIGVVLSFCGLMVVMISQTTGFTINIGLLFLLIAAFSGSAMNIFQRLLVLKYTAFEVATYAIIVGTICMLVFLPAGIRELQHSTLPANLAILYMALFPAVLAYMAWGYALSKAEKTTHVTVFMYLVPFLATLIGYFWLGETLSPWAWLGGIIIIAGMVLTNVLGRAKG